MFNKKKLRLRYEHIIYIASLEFELMRGPQEFDALLTKFIYF